MCIQLWQLDTIAVDDKEKTLIALFEAQESTIEDLRRELAEETQRADDAEWDEKNECGMRIAAEEKLDKIEEILTDDEDEKIDRIKILLGC